MNAGVAAMADRYRMAHPTSPRPGEDWPAPRRPRVQYGLAVAVETITLGLAFAAILAALGAVAAAFGVDAGAPVLR